MNKDNLNIASCTAIRFTNRHLEILRHALYGGSGEQEYRNYFVTGPDSTDFSTCEELCKISLMRNCGSNTATGGMDCFRVTEEGKELVRKLAPPALKLTRSQRRYREWLKSDCGLSFEEWIKMGK